MKYRKFIHRIEVEEIYMKLEEKSVPVSNTLLSDYWKGSGKLEQFYEYRLNDQSFEERVNYLQSKSYNTKELSNIIRSFMEPFGISEKVEENLKHLEKGAFAIVGGQQAGILTGPLYSVYKAITVILLAKQQSEKLQKKIVPIFWIAGEDHDIHEINHTYTIVNGEVKKRIFPTKNIKTMASETLFDKSQMKQFVKEVFQDYGETNYTSDIYQFISEQIEVSDTFTQFFARLMNHFFQQEGLLLIDAAYGPFRKYESKFFQKIIENNEEIAELVFNKEASFQELGYGKPINAVRENANLFFVKEGERILLERKNDNYFNEQYHVQFTKEELFEIAETQPERLSNNVVTRPLMQEMTIPVLAFVGGPGELAYWGLLKDTFRTLDLQMPIFVPRISITVMTKKLEQLIESFGLTFEQILAFETKKVREKFIESIQDKEVNEKIDQLQQLFTEKYKEIEEHLENEQLHLHDIIQKNLQYHERQFQYLKNKIEQQIVTKHETVLRQLAKIENEIVPNESLQERIFNPYHIINEYGEQFVQDLLKLPFKISNKHYIVYI